MHAFPLKKGQSIQVAVAIVTSKGLHVSKSSNVSRYEGEWMTTLNGELLGEETDYAGKKQNYTVNILKTRNQSDI